MNTKTYKVGDQTKIFLKGESPWGTVVETDDLNPNEKVKVRIDNKLFPEYSEHEKAQFTKGQFGTVEPLKDHHGKKKGDEVWCKRGEYGEWIPDI